ncbi:MAG: hypothetical protein JOZ66_13590 [Hyphomicrobiales bacterium]|nr:hypothetical protein [Hyphomicrobiales bacterium]
MVKPGATSLDPARATIGWKILRPFRSTEAARTALRHLGSASGIVS